MANTKALAREERRPLCRRITDELPGDLPGNTENDSCGSDEIDSAFYALGRTHLWRLYVSHFLSTWNTRTYEFAAVSV
jgi:hypothetical protein